LVLVIKKKKEEAARKALGQVEAKREIAEIQKNEGLVDTIEITD